MADLFFDLKTALVAGGGRRIAMIADRLLQAAALVLVPSRGKSEYGGDSQPADLDLRDQLARAFAATPIATAGSPVARASFPREV